GLVGAGTAGRWKGFGWIRLDDGQASSQRALGPEVISELRQYSTDLNTYFQDLLPALQTSGLKSIDKVRLYGRELVSQIASLLTCVSDVHVARHVDIDGIQQNGSSPSNPYSQTVETARRLVRTLEAVAQAVYNDTAVFLFTLQSVRDSDLLQYRQERKHAWDH
ncbi:Cell division control protein 25, partial [Termitomyces sp. T112]